MDYARLQSPATGMGLAAKAAPLSAQRLDQRLVICIMVASVTYQALLCLSNTHFLPTSRALVGVAEGVILLACLPILVRRLLPGVIIIAMLVGAMLCLLTLFTGYIDIKAFRDLAIPLCFFWLGCNIGKPELADRALTVAIGVVLTLGLMEFFFLEQYTNLFNIFSYYVSTGNLNEITEYTRDSKLQMNGTRPEGIGRTLLPGLLGSHRVSSVFLEPVSLGNFAAMIAAWGLSRDRADIRKGAFFVGAALVLMVLSDSRFALMSVSILTFMRLTLHGKAVNVAVLAPFLAIAMLLVIGTIDESYAGDNFRGRLAVSGWSLLDFDVSTLLGAGFKSQFGDQGYAYALSSFGLPLCLLMWFSIWFLPMPDARGQRFRAYISIYVALILCISGTSLFAFKSAGFLWFLLGIVMKAPAPMNPKSQPLIERVAAFRELNTQAIRGKDAY